MSRFALGPYRSDVNVIWDLAPHDFSILCYLLGEFPTSVRTSGRSITRPGSPDVAFMTLQFPSDVVAEVSVSWLAPRKVRNTIIVGDSRMLVYDDMDADEPIKLHDKRFVLPEGDGFGEHQLTYRTGDTVAPLRVGRGATRQAAAPLPRLHPRRRVPFGRMVRRGHRRGAGGCRRLVSQRWGACRRGLSDASCGAPHDACRAVRPEHGRARRPACVERGDVAGRGRLRGRRRRAAYRGLGADASGSTASTSCATGCLRERPGVVGQLLEAGAGFVGTARPVARLRREGPIDVLHVANPPDTLFPLAWWLRRSGTRFVYDQHDPTPELLAAKLGRRPILDRVLRLLERATYAAADLVIVGNNSCRRLVIARSGLPAERVVTIRLGPRSLEPTARDGAGVPTVGLRRRDGVQDTVERAHRRLRHRAAAATGRRPPRARSAGATPSTTCDAASPSTASRTPSRGRAGCRGTRCAGGWRRPPSACRPTSTTRTPASRR